MDEKLHTLQLTLRELCTVRLELERLAEEHEKAAADAYAGAMIGYGNFESVAYWREQAALCRAVVKKAQAALDAGPSGEV